MYPEYMARLSAEDFIRAIAQSYVELSHDKAYYQRDEMIASARLWMKRNGVAQHKAKPFDDNF
jgi:hypothetical protein